MSSIRLTGEALWQRMENAVERVRERLQRVVRALQAAGVPYAISGGNAVRVWVAQVDDAAVRTTQDIDILLRREDLPSTRKALEAAGFVFRHGASTDMFLDGPNPKARDAVHIIYAGEKVRDDNLEVAPDVTESDSFGGVRIVTLQALVRMKLSSYRRKDQVHLLDMIDVGLVDTSWLVRLQPALAARLRELLENPDG